MKRVVDVMDGITDLEHPAAERGTTLSADTKPVLLPAVASTAKDEEEKEATKESHSSRMMTMEVLSTE